MRLACARYNTTSGQFQRRRGPKICSFGERKTIDHIRPKRSTAFNIPADYKSLPRSAGLNMHSTLNLFLKLEYASWKSSGISNIRNGDAKNDSVLSKTPFFLYAIERKRAGSPDDPQRGWLFQGTNA